ncbi:MAG: glycoside hydrolase family 88 protein, partial [Propionibacteriaceae bacterium]
MPTPQELLAQVAGTITAQTLETWNFGESVAFEGLLGASRVLADPSWEAFSWGYFRSWAASRTEFRELDCTFPGVAAVRIADARRDALLAEALTGLVDYLLARPKIQGIYRTWRHSPLMRPYGPAELTGREAAWVDDPPAGAFLDCLHFEPPLFAALGVLLGRDDLIRQAEEQTLAYIAALQQPDGLFHHFVLDGVEGSFGPGWGRGQGWALLGLLDVIEELQAVRPPNPDLLDAAQRLIGAMVSVQRPDGHWFAQVDVPTSGDEFSTAGFMAYGFSRAARLG